MIQAQNGDHGVYKQLLSSISTEIGNFIRRKVSNPDDREDILQDILISIHNARHTYTPGRPFKPWLYAVANHKIIDYYRSRARRSNREQTDEGEHFIFIDETENALETKEYIEDLLSNLTPKQQKILRLLKLERLSVKETASILGMSVSAVKVNAHRAYKVLRKINQNENR